MLSCEYHQLFQIRSGATSFTRLNQDLISLSEIPNSIKILINIFEKIKLKNVPRTTDPDHFSSFQIWLVWCRMKKFRQSMAFFFQIDPAAPFDYMTWHLSLQFLVVSLKSDCEDPTTIKEKVITKSLSQEWQSIAKRWKWLSQVCGI